MTVAPISRHMRALPVAPGVPQQPRGTVKHLSERDAAQRRVDEVVQGRVVGFAEILPGAAAEGRHGRRLIEAQAVGPASREVVVALIRVADLVDGEVVQVPDPSLLHVVPPRLGRDPGGHLPADEVRHAVHHVDDGGLKQGPADAAPGTAFARPIFGQPGGLSRGLCQRARRKPRCLVEQRNRLGQSGWRWGLGVSCAADGETPKSMIPTIAVATHLVA